jgi:hypothetical protein
MHLPTFWCDGESSFCIIKFRGRIEELNKALENTSPHVRQDGMRTNVRLWRCLLISSIIIKSTGAFISLYLIWHCCIEYCTLNLVHGRLFGSSVLLFLPIFIGTTRIYIPRIIKSQNISILDHMDQVSRIIFILDRWHLRMHEERWTLEQAKGTEL